MGTWSHQPFGNDTAADWAWGLDDVVDLSLVENTLDAVLALGDDYVESAEAEEAIAAIEVLAKLRGRGTQTDAYTEAVDSWVARHPLTPSSTLIAKALAVLERLKGPESELAELWEESGELEDWLASLDALREALTAVDAS